MNRTSIKCDCSVSEHASFVEPLKYQVCTFAAPVTFTHCMACNEGCNNNWFSFCGYTRHVRVLRSVGVRRFVCGCQTHA